MNKNSPLVLLTQLEEPGKEPASFDYPFQYQPHPWAMEAARDLQSRLPALVKDHDFDYLGKMFGVLVVRNSKGELGYLSGFSGKLDGVYVKEAFVPPVFDVRSEGSFYLAGEAQLYQMTEELDRLEKAAEYQQAKDELEELRAQAEKAIIDAQRIRQEAKKERKKKRMEAGENLSKEMIKELSKQSVYHHFLYKDLKTRWEERLEAAHRRVKEFEQEIQDLQQARKEYSASLQNRIFASFKFLNADGEKKDLLDLFRETPLKVPPAGAGECAAPRLLQYAFQHDLEVLCMAEFWWGKPTRDALRRHGMFYPACRGKCGPILSHMLSKTPTAPNPIVAENLGASRVIKVIYEDDDLAIIEKPDGLLSVPGKDIEDSVWLRIREKYPDAEGPLIVHRLDMATSGILLIPLTFEAYKHLQQQFIKRTIHKNYEAIVEGTFEVGSSGYIDLPLCLDYYERPRQMVNYDIGKPARTHWKALHTSEGRTRIRFVPITGRTHQLRVHAAHVDGLNAPIVGDRLYGLADQRLCLHARQITFVHPTTKREMTFTSRPPF